MNEYEMQLVEDSDYGIDQDEYRDYERSVQARYSKYLEPT